MSYSQLCSLPKTTRKGTNFICMESLELDQKAIQEHILLLQNLDYRTSSIKEIEELLFPLFKGLRMTVPSFDPGVYLYRSRICKDRPQHLAELSYPPPKYISDYGRANDIGQSMFYGSISKNVPFFELNAQTGDRLILSIWKTKANLLLNHVGFSEDVSRLLQSGRDFDSIYQFTSDTLKFNDLNTFVYNFLAASFARKISREENFLYKLSIAITNKLIMGGLLHGVLYPSIAMNGNSDNIVLKPSYVDESLEFVGVEYLEVVASEGMKYKYETLDSAVEIDNCQLKWTGKLLGWTLGSQKSIDFNSDGSDWKAKDERGNRSDPKPTNPIRNNLSSLEREYVDSFSYAAKVSQDVPVVNQQENLNVTCTLLLDFENRIRFLSFYIPKSINPSSVAVALIQKMYFFLEMDKGQVIEMKDENSGELLCTNRELFFNNTIYFFSESGINSDLFENYKNLHISIKAGK